MNAASDQTNRDFERELAMHVDVRDHLLASEGEDFRIPTTTVDQVLDELNTVEPSPWVRHYRDRVPADLMRSRYRPSPKNLCGTHPGVGQE